MPSEIHEPRELIISDDNLDYPTCKCGQKLTKIISQISLCSYPPLRLFSCDKCDFKGWVMLERSENHKNAPPCSGFKFSTGINVINGEHVVNLVKNTHLT